MPIRPGPGPATMAVRLAFDRLQAAGTSPAALASDSDLSEDRAAKSGP